MTPNPNPSPELIERLGTRLTAHLSRDRRDDRNWPLVIDASDLAEIVAVFSQTLPAPVSHASHTTGVVSHVDGIGDSQPLPAPGEVERKVLATVLTSWGHAHDARAALRGAYDETEAMRQIVALATVAAANDEAFARGIEAAAKVLDTRVERIKSLYADEIGMSDMRVACEMEAEAGAAAIRLLSQGGGK